MRTKHCCVIDSQGFYVTFVLVTSESNYEGDKENIYCYSLKTGESLLHISPPTNMVIPRWTGTEWEETATPEEIEEAERKRYEEAGLPYPPVPVEPQKTVAELEEELTLTQLGIAEAFEKALQAQADADTALLGIVEIYEMIGG